MTAGGNWPTPKRSCPQSVADRHRRPQCHDPLGHYTGSTYDALNRLTALVKRSCSTCSDLQTSGYGYDTNNHLASVTDPDSLTTSYGYDAFDDRTSVASPDTGTTTNTYDAAGNLKTRTDAKGNLTTYTTTPATASSQ